MKKLLGIVVLGLLLSGNAYAFVSWNFNKGYVYIALKNNQNLNDQINKRPANKALKKLNCANGFDKKKLKTLPPGYAEDAPELLKDKYQPLNMYKITCASAVVEKPKKQEPENNQTEKGFELKQTLLNSNMIMKSKKDIHTIEFNKNGTGIWSMGKHRVNIIWEVIDNNTFEAHAPKYNYSRATIDWNNLKLVYEDSRGDFWNYDIITPKKLLTQIAEQPKKKEKPKASPDDDKIVPAGSGSGFFVSKEGHAITNYHVIEGCDINKLSFKGSQTEVKVLAVDKVNDIAILKSNAKPDVIFPVSNEDVSLLEDVIVAGFPLGKQISSAIKTHKGVVTALAGAGDNYSFFQTDAAINQGNSGGPIINQKGNVVGIAVATWVEEGVQGVHFGIKSSTLKTFASANGLSFASPNYRELSNKDLGKLITKGTVYVECHMTVAKIKKMIAQAENRKAFFKEHK